MFESLFGRLKKLFPSKSKSMSSYSTATQVSIVVVACTALIVTTQFAAVEMARDEFRKTLNEVEYGKVGGEANYKLLREIQRDRTDSYLKDLEEKEPEYVHGLKKKIERMEAAAEKDAVGGNSEEGKLLPNEIAALKENAVIRGNSGATVSIVEFSDFACPFCKDFHNSGVLEELLKTRPDKVNYAFKAMPNPKYEGSEYAARAMKCFSETTGSGQYFAAIDETFSATGAIAEAIAAITEKSWLQKSELEDCVRSKETSALMEKDFGQGVYLKIRATPSLLLLNNENGRYFLLKGVREKTEVEEAVESLMTEK